jgi:hypothetical protein
MNYISKNVLKVLKAWTNKEIDSRFTFEGTHPYLRFGYWDSVDENELNAILEPFGFESECYSDWDDDCGYKCHYVLKQLIEC